MTALGLFAISLLALLIVGHLIAGLILRGKAIGMIDRTLGLVFGAARGALIMTLVYLGSTWIWPPPRRFYAAFTWDAHSGPPAAHDRAHGQHASYC